MRKVLISVGVCVTAGIVIAWLALLLFNRPRLTPLYQSGFSDAQVRQVEQDIREYFLKQMRASSSATERNQVASGSTTVDVRMIRMSPKKLEGFAKITLRDEESQALGLGEVSVPCEATMGMDSDQYIWKCQK
jgi:hypothetical protein